MIHNDSVLQFVKNSSKIWSKHQCHTEVFDPIENKLVVNLQIITWSSLLWHVFSVRYINLWIRILVFLKGYSILKRTGGRETCEIKIGGCRVREIRGRGEGSENFSPPPRILLNGIALTNFVAILLSAQMHMLFLYTLDLWLIHYTLCLLTRHVCWKNME